VQLIQRLRGGERSAAEELVRHYEPVIRRAIRVRLVNPTLRRTVDSVDICQSVMGSFFVRAALGQYDLNSPEQLAGLLIKLARNKVADAARRQNAEKRDHHRMQEGASAVDRVMDGHESPSQVVAGAELLQKFREKLQPDELILAEQRAQGREWNDLALERGESAEALRKRLKRAVDRVARELGVEEMIDED
jgi:DNA-directed RNA polymerase specialized sigma24 family protein